LPLAVTGDHGLMLPLGLMARTQVDLGLMLEGQEGLTWARWRHLCSMAEELFQSIWRSDHNYSVFGATERECIETWESLALCAEWTKRVEFGALVSPITFREPGMLARMAATVDDLAGGRLVLGLGAGWYKAEHRDFGIAYPGVGKRMDLLEDGIKRIRAVWRVAYPRPPRGSMPVLIGGSGERRLLAIVAREADEWNFGPHSPEEFAAKAAVLEMHCRAIGRDPSSIRRSAMFGFIIGRNRAEVLERAEGMKAIMPEYRALEPAQILVAAAPRTLVGTPDEIAARMSSYVELGVTRFMIQHFLMDDDDALRLLTDEVGARLNA
jgi:alkanesulfonate monooxygenase SsuD/methylene tetrahydromethanopterin reductase-like flavin-dependent oxidoreductase (luciferase family)